MPRVLLITYAYPPRQVTGSIRPAGLAKYLPEFGWNVTTLTPELPPGPRPPGEVIETGYQDVMTNWKSRLRMDPKRTVHEQFGVPLSTGPDSSKLRSKVIEAAGLVVTYPDRYQGWVPYADQSLSEFQGEVDAIISTSPPISCHIIGAHARRLFGCPWIADFRDLWAEQNLWGTQRFLRPLYQHSERKMLKLADALVTVSVPWAKRLRDAYPAKPVYSITNGFDPADFPSGPGGLTKYFSLTYTGILYEGKRDPTVLFGTLRDLIKEGAISREDVRVRFYGRLEPWLAALVDRCQLQGVVELHGVVRREEALARQTESQLLLLLGWSDPRETGQHTGKLFEYFGAARPILAVGGVRGVLSDTLAETRTGIHALDREQLRRFLLTAYREYKQTGCVSYQPDQRAVNQYTHRRMAARFAEVLELTTGQALLAGSHPSAVPTP